MLARLTALAIVSMTIPALAEELSPGQQRFVAINDAVAAAFDGVSNPKIDSMISALDRRSKALCQVAPSGVAAGWQAVISSISEDGGTIELMAAPTARLKATNLASIDPELAPEVGAMVRISGQFTMEDEHCFRQIAELTGGALASPVYEFSLTALSIIAPHATDAAL